jgi:hypothetical protein
MNKKGNPFGHLHAGILPAFPDSQVKEFCSISPNLVDYFASRKGEMFEQNFSPEHGITLALFVV